MEEKRKSQLIGVAKKLRASSTQAERVLWKNLRMRQLKNYKFRRQQRIGEYIVDFVCLEKKLVIEVDGGQHAVDVSQDKVRDQWLKSQGFRVLRFWNGEVLKDIDVVMDIISGSVNI